MKQIGKLRFVIYSTAFSVVFLLASLCTFPKDVLRDVAESSLTNVALMAGPKNRGVPQVTVEDVSFWWLSGVDLKGLRVQWLPQKNQPQIGIEFDRLKARLGLFALLTGSKKAVLASSLYGGDLSAQFKIHSKNEIAYVDVNASKLDFAKMDFIESILGAPLSGVLNLVAHADAKTELSKDGTGHIKINWENMGFGPGSINLPAGGFVSSLTVPKVALGKLSAELALDKGQIESKSFSMSGGDVEADLKLTISLGRQASSSRLSGDGWFSVKREFINTNETLKMLFDLIPELKEAQSSNGKVGLIIRGNVARPQFKLEKYQENKKPEAEAQK